MVIKLELSSWCWWPFFSGSFVWRRPFKVISQKTFLFLSLSSCYYLSDVCAFMGCALFKIVEAFFLVVVCTKIAKLNQQVFVDIFPFLPITTFSRKSAFRICVGNYTKGYFTKLQPVPTFDQIALETFYVSYTLPFLRWKRNNFAICYVKSLRPLKQARLFFLFRNF